MPDLSRILEDVYSPPAGEVEVASEAALDKAFADWVPSLADDATSTERSLFSMAYDEPTIEPARPTLEWLTTEVATDTLEEPSPTLANVTDLASFEGARPAKPETKQRHVGDHDNILPPRRRRSDRVGTAETAASPMESVADLISFTGGPSARPEADVHELARTDSTLELGRLHEETSVAEAVTAAGPTRWERASDNILPGRRATFRLLRR